jgi:two-component system sensor histidine kinase KdpD
MAESLPVPPGDPEEPPQSGDNPKRGKLKIFFGAFPGVGKTYAMLVAGRRTLDAGRDVVIGTIDTHADPDSESMLHHFEAIAPLAVEGAPRPGELDLDRVLARDPDVVLVDKLAHANPPGSRHPHRWNDVDEISATASTSSRR